MSKNTFLWIAQIATAAILLQTLYFKFSAAPESVYIFTQVGMEPYGRIGIGVLELISGILLLVPRWAWAGALLALGIISGAVMMHFTILGIEVQGDGGKLFGLAVAVWLLSALILWMRRSQIPYLSQFLAKVAH